MRAQWFFNDPNTDGGTDSDTTSDTNSDTPSTGDERTDTDTVPKKKAEEPHHQ